MRALLFLVVVVFLSCEKDNKSINCVFEPSLQTFSATDITVSSANISGTISAVSEGCDIALGERRGFVYASSPSPSTNDQLINLYDSEISTTLQNLESNTQYYARTFISNSLGDFYGNEISFNTSNSINYGVNEYSVLFQGLNRNYLVYIPESYDADIPTSLLFAFHGYGSSNLFLMSYSGFNDIATQENFIVVYPQGSPLFGISHWNVGGWTSDSTTDDIAFTDFLITTMKDSYNINEDRIYATGMSNGGFMSFLLACQMSDTFAAIASVTGSMTPETLDNCDPVREVPVLQIHGTNDLVVSYNGFESWTTPIETVLNYWVSNNACNETPQIVSLNDVDLNNNITVDEITFDNGTNESIVKHFKVYGGGHTWFDNADIDTSSLIWEFLSSFNINGANN